MIAVDTNILICLLIADTPEQVRQAQNLIQNTKAWISRTVLLETAWVLQNHYMHPSAVVAKSFDALISNDSFQFEDEQEMLKAIELVECGMDIADAIHLCCTSTNTLPFYTFDKNFIKKAKHLGFDVRHPTESLDH